MCHQSSSRYRAHCQFSRPAAALAPFPVCAELSPIYVRIPILLLIAVLAPSLICAEPSMMVQMYKCQFYHSVSATQIRLNQIKDHRMMTDLYRSKQKSAQTPVMCVCVSPTVLRSRLVSMLPPHLPTFSQDWVQHLQHSQLSLRCSLLSERNFRSVATICYLYTKNW